MQKFSLKTKVSIIVWLIVFIVMLLTFYQHQKKVEQLTSTVQSQKAVIEQMHHEHEQMLLSLYAHLTFCE